MFCKVLILGPRYILNNGESYHFISLRIVTWANLHQILSKALRFCPILDRAWINHQLEEGFCFLRVELLEQVLERDLCLSKRRELSDRQ